MYLCYTEVKVIRQSSVSMKSLATWHTSVAVRVNTSPPPPPSHTRHTQSHLFLKETQSKGFMRLMMADGERCREREREKKRKSYIDRVAAVVAACLQPFVFDVTLLPLSLSLCSGKIKTQCLVHLIEHFSCFTTLLYRSLSLSLFGHFAHSSSSTVLICHFLLSLSFFFQLCRPLFQLASLHSPLVPSLPLFHVALRERVSGRVNAHTLTHSHTHVYDEKKATHQQRWGPGCGLVVALDPSTQVLDTPMYPRLLW